MTKDIVAVDPQIPLIEAARIMFKKNFNGLPVVDKTNKLVGLITQQDLILKTHAIHLPTLIDLLSKVQFYRKDSGSIKEELERLVALKVADVMNKTPLIVGVEATISEIAELFANHHAVNPIPIVNHEGTLAGIVSRFDLLKFFVGPSLHTSEGSKISAGPSLNTERFVKDFESRFIFVSKTRTKFWLWIAIAFGIVGFVIAWAMILRIAVK